MKTISLSDDEPVKPDQANPSGQPDPNKPNDTGPGKTISEQDAINASNHTKINSIIGGSGISGNSNGSTGPTGNSVSMGGLVDAKLAVNLMDAILPSLLVLLLFRLGVKLRKSELQLTEKEKDTIAPILNRCLDTLLIHFDNPWTALAVTLITIYGSKVGEKLGVAILEKKVKKQEDEAERKIVVDENGTATVQAKPAPDPNWKPSEDLIKKNCREKKYPRKKAIEILKRLHAAGKIDNYGNPIKEAA